MNTETRDSPEIDLPFVQHISDERAEQDRGEEVRVVCHRDEHELFEARGREAGQ